LETLSEQVELSTIQAILSHNDHLFVHATNSRGIWGLKIWVEKRPDIDPVSLGLAIREDDWVYRVLEKISDFLTIEEIAKELAEVFITHKDKILEITFFDANDTRFIEFDDKWGLKSWIENWKNRILEIDKEILDYQNLVSLRSKLEQEKKAREIDLLRLEEKKEALRRSVSDILNKIQTVDHKIDISQKRQNELHDKNKFVQQQLNAPKLRIILYYLCVTVLILIAGTLIIIGEIPYKIIGLLILLIVVLFMLRLSQSKRRVMGEAKTIEDSIFRIDHQLVQLNKELSDLNNEESLIQTECASIGLKINEAQSDLENSRGGIEGIKEEVNKYNVPLLYKEKETLIRKLKTAGVI
jgi:peptidoglycan hydrolase CwlO-like protein